MKLLFLFVLGIVLCLLLGARFSMGFFSDDPKPSRKQIEKLFGKGNFKEAFEGYRALALNPKTDALKVGEDLRGGTRCLIQLGRINEIDAFRDAVVAVQKENWRLLQAAAESLLEDAPHFGSIVAGEFFRGQSRNEGRSVGSYERDRVLALQLMLKALDRARKDDDRSAAGRYFMLLAQMLLADRAQTDSWRLQSLTSLDSLPDYDQTMSPWGWRDPDGQTSGAPVEADGTPVNYHVPESFEKARNDGERWRWALMQAAEIDPGLLNDTRKQRADFLQMQFGVQTVSNDDLDDGPAGTPLPESGPLSLSALGDDETIARLATGIRRFSLPPEFNPIRIYRQIVDEPKTGFAEESLNQLASIYENRRQFGRAAETWKDSKTRFGDPNKFKQSRIDQILKPWGQFESLMTLPAGQGAKVDFRFRNGKRVAFEAHEVKVDRLLADVKDYIASNPKQMDWQKSDLSQIGNRLIQWNQPQYLGRSVAKWELDLDPPAGHVDRRLTVSTPLQKAGVYLVSARMDDGNVARVLVWLDDTVLLKKALAGKAFYFVADARDGSPVAGAEVELLGWRYVQVPGKNEFRVEVRRSVQKSDANGQVLIPGSEVVDKRGGFQWVSIAKGPGGRLAFLGFSGIWVPSKKDPAYNVVKVYTITDRPVYRPGSPVKFKFWVARARYDQPGNSEFAGASFPVEVHDPKDEKIFTGNFTADAFGGFDGSFELPSNAPLGVYQVILPGRGGGTFRVEEYKKPEFEVNVDAPTKPVMLGEKVSATIKAKYYFGSPVAEAKVKYKITRTRADARWYPAARWDWLYGSGYWWFAADSSWYPGWARWGCLRPSPWWWGRPEAPPEVVAEAEMPIRPDGTVPFEIDTALAKAVHPDQDQRYEITAEVTDQSRRTIVGSGTVMVARRPFSVTVWVDRGHYKAGDTIEAGIKAQTLDHRPVAGKGTLALLKLAYDAAGKPTETPIERWEFTPDDQGEAHRKIKAAEPGQYRLSATVDDGQGHVIEGGYLLTIAGQGFDGASFQYNDLELIPDRADYRPGETVRLMINSNQIDATVLLFVRPTNGVYLPPRMVRLRGKSAVEEIGIVTRDMPNFFVEAQSISGGKVHTEVREIVVPPESRVVGIEVTPSQSTYRPGQKSKVRLRLTGPDGKPFVGSTVLTVYDKAVEYISGGSNVPEIKEFFWKWRRTHQSITESSLDRGSQNLMRQGETPMEDLGSFGWFSLPGGNQWGELAGGRFGRARGRKYDMGGMGGSGLVVREDPEPEDMMFKAEASPRARMFALSFDGAGPSKEAGLDKSGGQAQTPMLVQPAIRTNFADTAFWSAAVETAADGTTEVEVPLPDSLTTWKVKAWTLGAGTKVGEASAEIVTSKDLLIRLQAPRFFVQKDEVVLTANVHNKLKAKKSVQVVLELEGSVLEALGESTRIVEIPAGAESRIDWRVKVAHEGQAVVRMKALTDEESDAAQMSFPAYVHGMLKQEAFAGTIRPDGDRARVVIHVPADRRPEQSRLEVRYSPTLAGAMVDALPYLADYPYGCTEQTLNRFVPTVITQKILIELGLDLKAIRDKRTNLNAQELGNAGERAKRWKGYPHNPVFDQAEVAKMAAAGIQRLADMQLSGGGWGWFSGYGEVASAHTTALVVHGLQLARKNDLALPAGLLEGGVEWLTRYQAEQVRLLQNGISNVIPNRKSADNLDAMVFMVLNDAGVKNETMLGFLDRDRTNLSVYAKALFGLALEKLGDRERLAEVMRNIRQYVVEDAENQTAYLKLPNQGTWWWWYGSETETDAMYLKLLARTEPKGELAPRLVKYVLNNRRHGAYWESTRDTAFCIEALADYLKASGEDRPEMTVSIDLDGQHQKEVRITPADLFTFDNALVLEGKALEAGSHTINLRRSGAGPLYFNAYLTNFTLEDPIKKAGLEVKVNRKVYRLVRDDRTIDVAGGRGQAVGQRVERFKRELLPDGAMLKSGELVEVELEIDSKNDYEYLIFEDFKAAGFEPVEVRSGYNGNDMGAYVEFRDERVAFFVRSLGRGKHSVSYRLRAEIPGSFHALPASAQAMYAPELKGNSDEIRLSVED